jgi:hypothetical protein
VKLRNGDDGAGSVRTGWATPVVRPSNSLTTTPQTHPAIEPLLVSASTAAAMLGISQRLLWSLTAGKEIPHVRIRRRVMYDPNDLREYLAARKQEARR